MKSEAVDLRPIEDEDVGSVARFLHDNLNTRVSPASWAALMAPSWVFDAPNHGFQLAVGSRIVGVYVAVYSERDIDGTAHDFCNLAAFCVLDDYRSHSFRLLRALLGQKGFEFTDLSPSGNVVALNERLGFTSLDTETLLTPNLPRVGRRSISVSSAASIAATVLEGVDAAVYRDHRTAAACRHITVQGPEGYAYLVVRKDRRKGLPIFATPLYSGGDRDFLRRAWGHVGSHLLLHHGALATLAEPRILGFRPRVGLELKEPRPKMYRSKTLTATHVDYLYSELALLEW